MNNDFRKTAPPVNTVPNLSLPQMEERRLAGGVTLRYLNGGSSPVTQITAVREGGRAEFLLPPVATIFAPMLREGSQSMSANDFSNLMEFNGALFKTGLLSHHHTIQMLAVNDNLAELIEPFADLALRPAFEPERFAIHRERAAQFAEVNAQKVKSVADTTALLRHAGANHPLAMVSSADEIRAVEYEQIVEAANRFNNNRLTIYLSGQLSDKTISEVSDLFGAKTIATNTSLRTQPFVRIDKPSVTRIELPEAVQSAVAFTLPAVPRNHPDYLPLHITVMALGGYFGSRLMTNIREQKGYTYGISAGLLGFIDDSMIKIEAEAHSDFIDELIGEVKHELKLLASNPPTGEELERLRQASASNLLTTLDNPLTVTAFHITKLTSGIPQGYFDAKRRLIENITSEQIAEMAVKYLRPELMDITVAGLRQKSKINC